MKSVPLTCDAFPSSCDGEIQAFFGGKPTDAK